MKVHKGSLITNVEILVVTIAGKGDTARYTYSYTISTIQVAPAPRSSANQLALHKRKGRSESTARTGRRLRLGRSITLPGARCFDELLFYTSSKQISNLQRDGFFKKEFNKTTLREESLFLCYI